MASSFVRVQEAQVQLACATAASEHRGMIPAPNVTSTRAAVGRKLLCLEQHLAYAHADAQIAQFTAELLREMSYC